MTLRKKTVILLAALTIVISGCSNQAVVYIDNEEKSEVISEKVYEEHREEEEENIGNNNEINVDLKTEVKKIDLQEVKPNEAGQIMVLMYHHISEPEAEWTRTPENFRKDLKYLYESGYRPISLRDYALGNITTEAGYTPVVLTFDDGRQNNFNMIQNVNEEWVIDPDSAVGILVDFHEKNPDFPLEATFFVNDNIPFGQNEHLKYKLNYIIEKGMDIGNHTATHVDFTNSNEERIQKELAGIIKLINEHSPDYEVNTLALPFGSRPKDKSLTNYLNNGEYEGIEYENNAILNVGWDPYKSPYHKDFDSLSIHRIRASEIQKYVQGVGMYDWIERFEKGERTKFVSDGDPNIVTVPLNFEEVIDKEKVKDKQIRTYELEK